MKPRRIHSLLAQLTAAESALRASLLDILPLVEEHGSPLFTNSRFNPYTEPTPWLIQKAEEFLQSSEECVTLRRRLLLPTEGTVGELYLACCREAASGDPHRRGPRRLAAALRDALASIA